MMHSTMGTIPYMVFSSVSVITPTVEKQQEQLQAQAAVAAAPPAGSSRLPSP